MSLFGYLRGALSSRRLRRGAVLGFALAVASPMQAGEGLSFAAPDEAAEAFRKNVTLLGIPSATTVPGGYVFASVAKLVSAPGLGLIFDDSGASAAFGVGVSVGDMVDVQLATSLTSLTDDFADSGFFSLKAARRIEGTAVPVYVGLTASHLGAWGDAAWRSPSYSAAVTAFPAVNIGAEPFPLMLTAGVGTDVRIFNTDPGFFAGAGIGLTENVGSSVAWNGDDLDLGVSLRHRKLRNWGTTATLHNVTNRYDLRRVSVTVNWISDKLF